MIDTFKDFIRRISGFFSGNSLLEQDKELEQIITGESGKTPEEYSGPFSPRNTGSLYQPPEESAYDSFEQEAPVTPKEAEKPSEEKPKEVVKEEPATQKNEDTESKNKIDTQEVSPAKEAESEKILPNLTNLIAELDAISNRLDSEETKEIIKFCQQRILETMSGEVELIDNTSTFSSELHTPVPFQIIPNGHPIAKYLRPGIKHNGKILLKALVEVAPLQA